MLIFSGMLQSGFDFVPIKVCVSGLFHKLFLLHLLELRFYNVLYMNTH